MPDSADEMLKILKPKHRRLTPTGHTAPEPDAKSAAKTTAKTPPKSEA